VASLIYQWKSCGFFSAKNWRKITLKIQGDNNVQRTKITGKEKKE